MPMTTTRAIGLARPSRGLGSVDPPESHKPATELFRAAEISRTGLPITDSGDPAVLRRLCSWAPYSSSFSFSY